MPSKLTLLTGDAGSGKTDRLLAEYRAALKQARERRRPGTVLWIAPTHRAQQTIVERLLNASDPVQLAPRVLTFDVFAEQILAATGRPATLMSPVMKRLLLRRIVADLSQRKQLVNFAAVTQTTGFLDVVSAFISELKREEIWPDEFLEACAHRPPKRARRDRELGLIYDKYQHHLARQNWYDNEGRFWLARTALNNGERGPFASVEFLVVDGFADFTQTQYEILGRLMDWIPRAMISLPYEEPSTRPELFDKPRATVDRIRKHLPVGTDCSKEVIRADRSSWPGGLRTVAQSLFSNPRAVKPVDDAAGLQVIAATGPLGECQAVAMRVKRLLIDGTPPSRIVVAVRPVTEAGPVWREYFDQAGIPAWCEAGTPLASSPLVKGLFSILQLELEDWPFSRLTQVLGSNYFRPTWPELTTGHGSRVVPAALRRLKLHAGRDLILRVLSRVAGGIAMDEESGDEERGDTPSSVATLARHADTILKRLSYVTDRLRQRRSLADWGDVISSLGNDLGWQHLEPGRDSQDWDLLQRILRTAGETDRRLVLSADTKSVKQPRLDLAGFTAELRDLLGGEQIKAVPDPGGCVRILDVEQARHLDVPHLFIVGLSESSFPLNRGDDCLFGEVERQDFARRGLPLQHREQHQRDEMFLFYSVVTRARSQLTLSFPAVNSKGQPVFASPYLVALRSLFTEAAIAVSHEGQLDPVPTPDRTMTESDLRLLAISTAQTGHPGLFARLGERTGWLETGRNILAAIDVNQHRFHERGFTGYEGRLSSEQNLNWLHQRFGARHQFSATELESYASCPFRFWVSSVLNVDDLLTPEEGTDYAARGSLVHDVLAQLLREGIDKPPEQLAARFHALVEGHLARRFHETELQRALTLIEQRLLQQWGDAFARQQDDYAKQLQEVWNGGISALPPEIPFGRLPGSANDGEMSNDPLRFGHDQDSALVRGRIDRVDTGISAGQRVFNVIDYKTGSPPRTNDAELETGRAIQLALYAVAIRRLQLAGLDAQPYQMGYWSLKATGFKRGYQRDTKTLKAMDQGTVDSLEQALETVIPQLARGIRDGKFLVENADDNCTGYCAYHTTCRVNQIRPLAQSLNKIGNILNNRTATAPPADSE
ncbi:MAG: PD-(D/E)XK nuclease family protein [Planctomycetes bacterium]|nr:PD-(D/E)XK nuclease family protein [Planctomycetota bacterium]